MKKVLVQPGQVLQRKGDYNTSVFYVERGLLRSFIINEKGKEYTYMFAPEGWYIGDSNLPEQPCELYIDALEPSVVYEMNKQEAIDKHDKMTLVNRIAAMQHRILRLMSSSTLERYEYFLGLYPGVSQRVSQRMIASFLGVTPEALSKVKGDRLRRNKGTS